MWSFDIILCDSNLNMWLWFSIYQCQDLPNYDDIFWAYILKDYAAKNQLLDNPLSKDLQHKIRQVVVANQWIDIEQSCRF